MCVYMPIHERTHAKSAFRNMGAAEIGAMAAGQKDAAGPTMMFAQVRSGFDARGGGAGRGGKDGEDGDDEEKLTKEETDDVGGRLREVRCIGPFDGDLRFRCGGFTDGRVCRKFRPVRPDVVSKEASHDKGTHSSLASAPLSVVSALFTHRRAGG